jgi:HK97 gp10 family phage protein
MTIDFGVVGLDKLQKKLNTIKNLEKDPRVDKSLGRGAARMQAAVKMLTPVDTGNLRNKIFLDHKKQNEWSVETNVEYAPFVEFGTGRLGDPTVPHTSKESWVYYSEKLKRFVTTQGQKPAAMFRKGFKNSHEAVYKIVRKEVEEIIRNG